MGELVRLEKVNKAYNGTEILKHVSLTIRKQQVNAFLGRNGVGKSTLLRMIAGIERPSVGKVTYFHQNINIGYVPERFPKDIRFTPSEYLNYIGKISGMTEANRKETIPALIKRFRLGGFDHERIQNLSKGNIQKVGIIQAIMKKPDLLLLDEPTSGLDSYSQQELLYIIKELKEEGTAILLTYHESNMFEKLVDITYSIKDRTVSMSNGVRDEEIKLVEVEGIEASQVSKWDDIQSVEERNGRLFLYVYERDSDQILYRILKSKGSIKRVVNVNCIETK